MEINDIKIFSEVAKLSSTSKAAKSLGYVQSNISKRILKLEEEIGRKLFFRTNKGMDLTSDGEKFLVYAKEILFIVVKMEKDFSINKEKTSIGGTGVISKIYLSKYYLNDEFEIFTRPINELIKLLKEEKLDFIFVNKEIDDKDFEKILTFSEKVYWIQSKNNKIDCKRNKVIVSRDVNCPYRIETFKYIEKSKIKIKGIVEVDTIDILIDMVENNEVISILPEKIIDLNNNLKKIEDVTLDRINIYGYKLKSNVKKLNIEFN
ncbi:LysR family transcriptional regulator [uncultured Clostridium sp.]|uniref:LysR family transcriptional regulator n=1 Tax=uncultured Clostridium sp. TaxID=59620 RepID=UPI0026248425|nr:LysR family transcriptional regulator [uncultured Clostridium sp.]